MDEKMLKVLAEASPILDKLGIIPQRSYLLGNGDMNCLFMEDDEGIVFNLTKNEVWDKRMNTEEDVDIITDAKIRELAMKMEVGKRSLEVNLDSNEPLNGKEDAYTSKPYPCPVICAKMRVCADMRGASHKLNLAKATVESKLKCGFVKTYISYDHNVMFMEGLSEEMIAELVPVKHVDMRPAEKIEKNGCDVLLQHMPADLDVAEYWYAVSLKRFSVSKLAVSICAAENAESAINGAVKAVLLYGEDTAVYEKHLKGWEAYWNRSYIEMDDKMLQNIWYRNTYALGCIARSGCVSPGLFASLSSDTPAWHGDYHTNYNYQAIFWGAYITNHCDAADVYDDIIISYLKRAKWIAKRVWGVEGAYYPHVLFYGEPEDPEQCRSRNGRQYFHHVWGRTLGVSAMTVQNLLMHWYHDPSPELLKKIYPVLQETSDFYVNLGDLREAFTVSPEHWGITPKQILNHECTFDITLIKYLIRGTIKAAETLGVDEKKRNSWQEYLENMPPYPTTDDYEAALGAGNEFLETQIRDCASYVKGISYTGRMITDIKYAPPTSYNIPAPLLPVFPGCDIDRSSISEEQKLASDSLKNMTTNGHNDFVMGAVSRIRMCMDDMHDYLHSRLADQEMSNGFLAMCQNPEEAYNSYGIYTEMLGITLAISEQLLQSNKGFIRLFPAMPEGQDACFRDLLAEGGVLVSAKRQSGKVVSLTLQPKYDGKICLCQPNDVEIRIFCDGDPVKYEVFTNDGGEKVLSFMGTAGKIYKF